MPNPRPRQTEEFKRKRFQRVGEAKGKLSEKPISVRVTEDVMEIIQSMPQIERVVWLRNVLTNAALKPQSADSDVVSNNDELEQLRSENAALKREIEQLRLQQTLVAEDYYTGVQLARRLRIAEGRVRAHRDDGTLENWSKKYDPSGWTWRYDLRIGRYYPVK